MLTPTIEMLLNKGLECRPS